MRSVDFQSLPELGINGDDERKTWILCGQIAIVSGDLNEKKRCDLSGQKSLR